MTRSVAVPFALCVLALLDGAFAGFRASAGRDARLMDWRSNAVSAAWGIAAGFVSLAAIALSAGVTLWSAAERTQRFGELVDGGFRMLMVFVPMAFVTLLAIGFHVFSTNHEASAVAMTVVLGPVTLVRPALIVVGGIAAAWYDAGVTLPTALVAVTCTSSVGPLIGRLRYS